LTGIVIRYKGKLTRKEVVDNADTTYYMVEDTVGRSYRGVLREPNVIRIPTRYSRNRTKALFNEFTIHDQQVLERINQAFDKARQILADGYDLVIGDIGSGMAQLKKRALNLYEYIQEQIAKLEQM